MAFAKESHDVIEDYKKLIDISALEEVGLMVTQAPNCPWQFFIKHPEMKHRFAYYPSTGSVVWEGANGRESSFKVKSTEELIQLVYSKV